MSTVIAPVDAAARPAATHAASGVPFSRLVVTEFRKTVDTRAGRWLLIVASAISVLAVGLVLWLASEITPSFRDLLSLASLPMMIFLPLIGILTATSEFSHRTGLVTFVLEPRRMRVLWAKLLASVVLGLVVLVVATLGAAVALAFWSALTSTDVQWAVPSGVAVGLTAGMVLFVIQGVAFGLATLNTPAAIVAIFTVPMTFTVVTAFISRLESINPWIDLSRAADPLISGSISGEQWAQLGTASLLWIALPFVIGMVRVQRREIV